MKQGNRPRVILGLLLGILALASAYPDPEDANLVVTELIAKYGYPIETHHVTTADGYILTIHRIPYGKRCGPAEGKRVAWLQHGLLGDASNWVVTGPEKGFAYNMADACYDVWMGNFRGNRYSRNHTFYNPDVDKEAFWDYSYNEIGLNDIPAFIDYAIEQTGVDKLYYIGHSMGTTAFWAMLDGHPEYNEKIKLMTAFAPVAYTEHMISPISILSNIDTQLEWFLRIMGIHEFLPSTEFMRLIGQNVCAVYSPIKEICYNALFLFGGYNVDQLDVELLPTMMGHMPSGASVRSLLHYSQGIKSQDFRKYDYGKQGNMDHYGQPTPPQYDLSRVTCPVAFYWGNNDWLGAWQDTFRLAEHISNLQLMYRVNHDHWSHLDFVFAKDQVTLLHNKAIDFMKGF